MSGNYNYQDKTQKLSRAYGEHIIHSGNGKLIEHEAVPTSSGLTVKARLALGESTFHEIVYGKYDGADILEFEFHKDSGLVIPSSTMFPTRALNGGASFVDYWLPPGAKEDNKPEKAVWRVKCSEIPDYDNEGNQIGEGYSTNAARVAAAEIIYLTGDPDVIDWQWWDYFKTFTSYLITINIDDEDVEVERFPLHFFATPPYDLDHILDRICQLTCSEWTWAQGKIRFIPPILPFSREPFNFNPGNINRIFEFESNDSEEVPYDGVIVSYRDINTELLEEAEPVVISRREDDEPPENPYLINAANCRKDVAERIGHFNAKKKVDLKDFGLIKASRKAYVVLPGDPLVITHPTPGWTNRAATVIKKTEKEDRQTPEGEEKFEGYGIYFQLDDASGDPIYSDDNFTPLETRVPVEGLNPFAQPSIPSITLSPQSITQSNGMTTNQIVGEVLFGNLGVKQTGKVYVMRPGSATFEKLGRGGDLTPDTDNKAIFIEPNIKNGTYFFKVIAVSEYNVQQPIGVALNNPKSIVIDTSTLYVDGIPVSPLLYRSGAAIRSDKRVTGRDGTDPVPIEAIEAKIDSAEVVNDRVWCVLSVTLKDLFDGSGNRIHNQADSADVCQVDVFDQFGTLIKSLAPAPVKQKASTPTGSFSRKYADALDGQCWFRIKILNANNWSGFKYLRGNTLGNSEPTKKVESNCPRDLKATVLAVGLRFSYQFSGAVYLYKRVINTTSWGDAIYYNTGVSPFDVTSLPANEEFEYILASASDTSNRSNIIRAKTLPQPPPPPTYAAPLGITASLDATFPTTIVNGSVSLGVTDKYTKIYNYGVLVTTLDPGDTGFSISGLSEGQTLSLTAKHDYGSGNLSDPCAAYEITTAVTPPPSEPDRPQITGAEYSTTSQAMIIYFDNKGNSGNFSADVYYSGAWHRLITNAIPNSAGYFTHSVAQVANTILYFGYRVGRNGSGGFIEFGNEEFFEVPPGDDDEPPGGWFPELP